MPGCQPSPAFKIWQASLYLCFCKYWIDTMLSRFSILRSDSNDRSATIPSALPIMFFLRITQFTDDPDKQSERVDDRADFARIRCPLCRWQPSRSSRWICGQSGPPENYNDGCGTRWNTFETRGQCPGCSHQWVWTACLRCHEFSRHVDWYGENSK